MKFLATAALMATTAVAQDQIHLALTGNPDEMHVSYVYENGCPSSSSVAYGPSTSFGQTVYAETMNTDPLSGDCWIDVTMTSLKPNVQYYYSIDGSTTQTFVNQHNREGGKVYAVLADFGLANDVSLGQLTAEATNNVFDVVIHAGDYAYDLQDEYGQTGDDFMNGIQAIAATKPYMGSPGNHESDDYTFAQYLGRFNGFTPAAKNSGSDSMLWYSFDDGLVHFISIDTELWYYNGTPEQIQDQYTWLQNDLASVNRTKTPWVVAFGHKQGWMDKVDFNQTESILQAGGVNLYFCGHQHNYQRFYSMDNNVPYPDCYNSATNTYSDCSAMISMVVGSPGCKEGLSTIAGTIGAIEINNNAYGYGHLSVHNATHAQWQWEEIGQRDLKTGQFKAVEGAYADYAWIIQGNRR